ncbi:hypothetical protein Tco_0977134 [Tanacetum coccineum]|uniref:Uncharacterized protein n=1 Tax=Tanacetum coccineum TaxID=301880 RepID=A0ABQ5EJQ9_9ASTR
MLVQGQILQGEGSTIPVESHHTPISAPSTSQPPTSPPSMQTTHVAEEAATMPYDSPLLRVHSLGSDEGIKSRKARRKVRLISEDEDELEDPSKQGRKIAQIDEDEGITLVQMSAQTQGRHEHDFEFIAPEEDYTTEPGTAGLIQQVNIIIPSSSVTKDKGKAIMTESKSEQTTTHLKQRQKRVGYEAAIRLQEQLNEEESQRISRDAKGFTEDEWEDIRERVEADEVLTQKLQVEERHKYSKVDQARMLVNLINQRKRYFAA